MLVDGETYIIRKRYYDINGYLTSSVEIHRGRNYAQVNKRYKEFNKNPESLKLERCKYTIDIGKVRFGEGTYS